MTSRLSPYDVPPMAVELRRRLADAQVSWDLCLQDLINRLRDYEGLVVCPSCTNVFIVPDDGRPGWFCPCDLSAPIKAIKRHQGPDGHR